MNPSIAEIERRERMARLVKELYSLPLPTVLPILTTLVLDRRHESPEDVARFVQTLDRALWAQLETKS